VNRFPHEGHVPVTSPSGLVVNWRGPPQLRHGRALGASNELRSALRYPPRPADLRNGGSVSERRTNWNEELQPEQTAESPVAVAEIARGAPQRLHGGPEGDPASPGRRLAMVPSSVGPSDPRPASTIPSSRVKECPQPAQEPVSS
jgi:hypothetical protein